MRTFGLSGLGSKLMVKPSYETGPYTLVHLIIGIGGLPGNLVGGKAHATPIFGSVNHDW